MIENVTEERAGTLSRPVQRLWRPMSGPGANRQELRWLAEVVRFCMEFGPPRAFQDWPEKLVREYVLVHSRQLTMTWCRTAVDLGNKGAARPVMGVGFGWPEWRDRIEGCTRRQECVWNWPTRVGGDCFYLGEWIVRKDSVQCSVSSVQRRREILRRLAQDLWVRFPEYRDGEIFYHRGGKLVQMSGRVARWAGLPLEENPKTQIPNPKQKEEAIYGEY